MSEPKSEQPEVQPGKGGEETAPAASQANTEEEKPAASGEAGALSPEEKLWGLLAHLLVFIGFLGVPFGNLIGPGIAYFVQKEKSKFVRFHALQSFFFQLAMLVIGLAVGVPIFLLSFLLGPLILLFVLPAILVSLALIVYVVVTGLKANHGEPAKYFYVGEIVYKKVYEEDWMPV